MRGKPKTVREFWRRTDGSLTVEFVVLVPLLLTALVFSFEFGRALWAYDVITRDVRASVRYLARTSIAPAAPNCPAATQTEAENIAKRGLRAGTAADDHFPWKGAAPTFTCSSAAFNAGFATTATVVTLTANVPISLSFLEFLNTMTGGAVDSDIVLTVSDQARWIGS